MSRRTHYSDEKKRAVMCYLQQNQGCTMKQAAQKFGVPATSVWRWKKKAEAEANFQQNTSTTTRSLAPKTTTWDARLNDGLLGAAVFAFIVLAVRLGVGLV